MSQPGSAGLARLQSQSRIAASKWRDWCVALDLALEEAVEVWEEICHPIMVSTGQVPPVPQILQLRVDRRKASIFDFKEEVAKLLAFIGFLPELEDESLVKGNWKAAILACYRKGMAGVEDYRQAAARVERFLEDELASNQAPPFGTEEAVAESGMEKVVEEREEGEAEESADVTNRFRMALCAIYNAETAGDGSMESRRLALLRTRTEVINRFDPMRVVVPSMEEARLLVEHSQTASGRKRIFMPVMKAPRPVGGADAAAVWAAAPTTAFIVSGGRQEANQAVNGGGRPSAAAGGASGPGADPPMAPGEAGVEGTQAAGEEVVRLAGMRAADFSQVVRLTGELLTAAEQDPTIWRQYLEQGKEPGDAVGLAAQLVEEGSLTNRAYGAIKALAQQLPLKEFLAVPDAAMQRDRRFAIEVPAYVNSVRNNKTTISPADRQLAPLGRVLDTAAAVLLRLENLRVNRFLAERDPDEYSAEAVADYRERALSDVLAAADPELIELARERAEADTAELVTAFEAEGFAEQLLAQVRGFVAALADEGYLTSRQKLAAVLEENPLEFELTVPGDHEGPPAEELREQLEPSALGEIYDTLCQYVCTGARGMLSPGREPEKIIGKIKQLVRELIPAHLILQPVKKRHSERPRILLSVVSLDKVSGNTLLRDLFVRVDVGGRIFFLERFRDGTYVDLLELRTYSPVRIQRNRDGEGEEPLQTGEKYLYTVGRTKNIFAATPEELSESCIRGEDGEIKVFPLFRATTRS